MRETDISIIIPTLNEDERMGALLPYLQKSSANSAVEIIIADGGSTDQTLSIAAKNDVRIVRCNKKGRALQMNEGAEMAAGSVLYFLHADTIPPPEFIAQINRALNEGYSSGCFRLTFDDTHPVLKIYAWFTRFRTTLFRFGDQSLFVKKELFQKIGGFDEEMVIMEDQKMVRLIKREAKFKVLSSAVTTSARRYQQNGEIWLQLVFTLIVLMYYLGVSQKVLVHVYQSFIRSRNQS